MEDNKTVVDFTKKTEETNPEPKVPVATEKPGFFKTVFNVVTAPARWVGRKVRESPAAAGIGMVLGGALSLGAKAAIQYFTKSKAPSFIPADPVEVSEDISAPFNTTD